MLETERLLLRQWRDSDREPFAAMGRDPQVMHHFPSLLTREQSDETIDRRLASHIARHGFGLWALERKGDGAFLGFTGLSTVDFDCPIAGEVEIGWRLARHAWGHGYALEAARASARHGFDNLGLTRIFAMCVEANSRSRRVMDRLGMRRSEDLDFDHPRVPENSPLRPHIVYLLDAADLAAGA